MIEELKDIEKHVLADLLKNPSIWNTVDVNYHQPRVERLWTQVGESRLMLHVIHPCAPGESLYHPHPWPSAMHILKGKYETGVAHRLPPGFSQFMDVENYIKIKGEGEEENIYLRQIFRSEAVEGTCIEMLDPAGWHFVRPIEDPCYTLMLIGKPFEKKDDQDVPKTWGKLPELEEVRKLEILRIFREIIRLKDVSKRLE